MALTNEEVEKLTRKGFRFRKPCGAYVGAALCRPDSIRGTSIIKLWSHTVEQETENYFDPNIVDTICEELIKNVK